MGVFGCVVDCRGVDRKIEVVEVLVVLLGEVRDFGVSFGVIGRLGVGMYRELVVVMGFEGCGVLREAEVGIWLGIFKVKLGRGVGFCGEDKKGGGARLRFFRFLFVFLGVKGRKIIEVVFGRCFCKFGVKGLVDRLKMFGVGVEVLLFGRKGLGLVVGVGERLDGSIVVFGGVFWVRGGDCRFCSLSMVVGLFRVIFWVLEVVRWRCCLKSWIFFLEVLFNCFFSFGF